MTSIRQPKRLRRPEIAVDPKGCGFTSMAAHHLIDVLAPDSIDVTDLDGLKGAALDPVTDRLGGQLELLSDLFDGEKRLIGHHKMSKDIAGRIAI